MRSSELFILYIVPASAVSIVNVRLERYGMYVFSCRELLAGGADVSATNNQQETPLDIARNTRNIKIVK